jgi:formylglycine-generating enzyme required for sulfatase activity
VHRVELAAFRIAQFPITNAEWALFMSAGGYEDERWWETDEARAWRRGEATAEGPKQQWRESRKWIQQHYAELHTLPGFTSQQVEIYRGHADLTDTMFEAMLDRWYPPGRRTEPRWWRDAAYNNPAQPVVGVSWHEARAYCAWLSAQTGEPYALPTEAQWEAAARGLSGRRYVYGKDFDAALCNTFETHIRRTTPIGVFPGGDTPEGLVDMSGNAWDWTSTLYRPYRYDAGDGREDATGAGPRLVRGGSWSNDQDRARRLPQPRRSRHPEPPSGIACGVFVPHRVITGH